MEIVAHRAGNVVADAAQAAAAPVVDMIEIDVHVLRGQVELRHAKVLHPTRRLWEKWYFLPRGTVGVPIQDVLAVLDPQTPLMVDLKCFTKRSARLIRQAIPDTHPIVASTRNWWILSEFADRPRTRRLRSCGTRWQIWWARNRMRFGPDEGVCIEETNLTPELLATLRERAPLMFSWGTTETARCAELEQAGLTGIILDDHSIVG